MRGNGDGVIKTLIPGWVHGEMTKLLNDLDGRECDVMVGAVAVMGEDGYDFGAREQSINMDPQTYGPVMLQGFNLLAAGALAKMLDHLHEALQAEDHFTQDIEDDGERLIQTRNIYEQTIREFLKEMLTHTGLMFQDTINKKPASASQGRTLSLIAGSQMIGVWQRVAASPLKFHAPPEDQDSDG